MWGTNDTSQLGLRNTEQALVPTRLDALENFQVLLCSATWWHAWDSWAPLQQGGRRICGSWLHSLLHGQLALGPC